MSSFPQVWVVWSVNTANLGIILLSLDWVYVGSGARGSVGPPRGCTLQGHPQCQGLQACLQGGWNMRMAPPAPNTQKTPHSQASGSALRVFITIPCRGDAWHNLCFTAKQVDPAGGEGIAVFSEAASSFFWGQAHKQTFSSPLLLYLSNQTVQKS